MAFFILPCYQPSTDIVPRGNHLSYFLKLKILVPSSILTAVIRQLLPAEQWLTETRLVFYYQFVV